MVSSFIIMAAGYLFMRFGIYRRSSVFTYTDPQGEIKKHEEECFKIATAHLTEPYTRDEETVNKMIKDHFQHMSSTHLSGVPVKKTTAEMETDRQDRFNATLAELQNKYVIRDWPLLIKGSVCMLYVLLMFGLHSIPGIHHMPLSWIALTGALLFLIVAEKGHEFEHILHQVEFATLLFFACLFVLMECESKLGLIPYIGAHLLKVLLSLPPNMRLPVAIISIIWVAGMASAFVDNIPVTTMMLKIVEQIHSNKDMDMPLMPLVVTLALAIGLGANGTQIGATTNIVAIGIAEQHGYTVSFMQFFK